MCVTVLLWTLAAVCVRAIEYYDENNEHIKILKQQLKALDSKEEYAIEDDPDEFEFSFMPSDKMKLTITEGRHEDILCFLIDAENFCVAVPKNQQHRILQDYGKIQLMECILKNSSVGWKTAATLCWDARTSKTLPQKFHLKP